MNSTFQCCWSSQQLCIISVVLKIILIVGLVLFVRSFLTSLSHCPNWTLVIMTRDNTMMGTKSSRSVFMSVSNKCDFSDKFLLYLRDLP